MPSFNLRDAQRLLEEDEEDRAVPEVETGEDDFFARDPHYGPDIDHAAENYGGYHDDKRLQEEYDRLQEIMDNDHDTYDSHHCDPYYDPLED